jgi:hypothetical protein
MGDGERELYQTWNSQENKELARSKNVGMMKHCASLSEKFNGNDRGKTHCNLRKAVQSGKFVNNLDQGFSLIQEAGLTFGSDL